MPLYY